MITTSDAINELATALSKAQGQMEGAKKDSANPFFRSKYADLASVWDACRRPLFDHGLSVVQFPTTEYQGTPEPYEWTSKTGETRHGVRVTCVVGVTTRLLHASGQWMEERVSTMLPTGDPQAVGSAITYLRRYSLQSVCGIAPEDDDGEGAMQRVQTATNSRAPERQSEPMAGAPVQVVSVTPRPTKKPGVTRFEVALSNGIKAATISEKLAKQATDARDSGAHVKPITKQTDYGTDLVALSVVTTDTREPELEEAPF